VKVSTENGKVFITYMFYVTSQATTHQWKWWSLRKRSNRTKDWGSRGASCRPSENYLVSYILS